MIVRYSRPTRQSGLRRNQQLVKKSVSNVRSYYLQSILLALLLLPLNAVGKNTHERLEILEPEVQGQIRLDRLRQTDDYDFYCAIVVALLKNWYPLKDANSRTILRLKIEPDNSLRLLKVVRSSGTAIDEAATLAASKSKVIGKLVHKPRIIDVLFNADKKYRNDQRCWLLPEE